VLAGDASQALDIYSDQMVELTHGPAHRFSQTVATKGKTLYLQSQRPWCGEATLVPVAVAGDKKKATKMMVVLERRTDCDEPGARRPRREAPILWSRWC